MKKFLVLVKKEIMELLTLELFLPLVAVVLIFVFIGRVIGGETAKLQAPQPVAVVDMDNSDISKKTIEIFKKNNLEVRLSAESNIDKVIADAKTKNEKSVLVIPAGFGNGILNYKPQKIETYTIVKNFSLTGQIAGGTVVAALAAANNAIGNELLSKKVPGIDPVDFKQPIKTNEFVIIADRRANVSIAAVAGFITSQTTFIPIILFIVILFAAQMVVTSVALEKENKTLEVLLSSPVSRQSIVAAKLVGAGVVSLLMAGFYMIGMSYYMGGLMSGATQAYSDPAAQAAIAQLGLIFGTTDYILLGLCLFVSILAALAIAIILGSFAEDTKSAQGMITPLMVIILVPYFLTSFLDISTLSPTLQWIVYAIPFSHTFTAASNILLGNYQKVWLGIGYISLFFAAAVFVAAKIFTSEKIFTLKINFKRMKIGR